MKLRHLLPLAALSLPLFVSARPAAPGLRTLPNGDGTAVEAYVYGNEDFSWVVSADGTTLLEYKDGKWTPVAREGLVLTADEDNIDFLRHEAELMVPEEISAKKRMAELDNNGRTVYPCQGEVHALVVLVEFADTPFTVPNPATAFNRMCNEAGYSAYNGKGSARDYFIATSNGVFRPTFDIVGPVRVSQTSEYYTGKGSGLNGDGKTALLGYAWEEALKKLDDEVDFSKYDYDEDGNIDNIFFFYAGYGQADSGDPTTIWPHQGDFKNYCWDFTLGLKELVLDGKKFRTYACSNELQGGALPEGAQQPYLDGIGAFVHEYGHVLGLPDTYDVEGNASTQTPGYWDVMANGTYNDSSTRPPLYNAYQQWLCRWLEYEDIKPDDSGHYVVPSLSKATVKGEPVKAYRLRMYRPGSTTAFYPEYFVVETRTKDGWDSALPGDGMMIWHVDYKKNNWVNNTVNYAGVSRFVPIANSHGSYAWPGATDDPDDWDTYIFKGGQVTLPVFTTGADYSPVISSISYDRAKGESSFDFNTVVQLSATTLLHEPEIVSASQRSFRLTWDKVEGATDYYVTVESRSGNRYETVDGYSDKPVGDVNEVVVTNIKPSAWTKEMRAYVRPSNEIPGLKISNIVNFVPANSGVGDIELDGVIKGEYGRVEAPAGARVFNPSGVETGTENLPAGIYIVAYEGKTVKVVVR